jgi:DNA-binding LacI/PurR family transcriptional regulator
MIMDTVPEDIAIVGFDDADEHTALTGAVSTVANPLQAMAADLIDRILTPFKPSALQEGHRISRPFHVPIPALHARSVSYDKEGTESRRRASSPTSRQPSQPA